MTKTVGDFPGGIVTPPYCDMSSFWGLHRGQAIAPASVISNPGIAVTPPNGGQAISVGGNSGSTGTDADGRRTVNGQIPGTSITINNPPNFIGAYGHHFRSTSHASKQEFKWLKHTPTSRTMARITSSCFT